MNEYVAFDLETTGLSRDKDRIIEIGAVKISQGRIIGKYNSIVDPEGPVSDFIKNLTGINQEMLNQGKPRREAIEEFLAFVRGYPVLGHNLMFDYSFMKIAANRYGLSFETKGVDTLRVARRFLTELENKKLETLCAHYDYVNQAAHRAYDDALATAVVFEQMKKEFPVTDKCFCPRQLQYKEKKERKPTEKQKQYLNQLLKYHRIERTARHEQMTQSELSREIDAIILEYGVMKK